MKQLKPRTLQRSTVAKLLAAVSLSLAPALFAAAEKTHAGLAVGEVLDSFQLRTLDGDVVRLAELDGAKAIVLAFNGIGCPISEQYNARLQKLADDFGDRGVHVIGINSNRQDTVQELRGFANEFALTFPILKDHDHALADKLGAKRTTEVFLLDGKRTLRYRGKIDDQYSITDRSVGLRKDRAEKEYLLDAVRAVLAGEAPAVTVTEPLGCVIGRKRTVRDADTVTYHRDIEPIIQRSCQSCHREKQIAPFPLLSYEDVAGWSGMIGEVIENRRMPPWHADPKHGKFANDRSLSDAEIRKVLTWIDNGTPKGDPKHAPEPVEYVDDWQIGKPDAIYEMPVSFDVPATGTVRYKYFVIATDLPEETWIQAVEVRAGAREAVHHILVFAVDPESPQGWRNEVGNGVRSYFAAMVPGEQPAVFVDGMAKKLPKRATLVFQVHYTTNGTAVSDRSRIGIKFAKAPVERRVKTASVFRARDLRIAANDADATVRAARRVKESIDLLSFLPHMHIRGSAFSYTAHFPAEVELDRKPPEGLLGGEYRKRISHKDGTLIWRGKLPDAVYDELRAHYTSDAERRQLETLRTKGRSEILLNVPAYDFGWQNTYRLETPRRLPRETLLEVVAVYNNSASNPALTEDMWTRSVRWGDQTWDEMLIGYYDYVPAKSD